MKNKATLLAASIVFVLFMSHLGFSQVKVLDDFEKHGIWKVDRPNHRCLIDPGVWVRLPFEQKEQCLQAIYIEEKTWWKIYDYMSGKLLGEVSSWGWKVYP